MKLSVTSGDISQAKTEALIVNLFEGVTTPGGGTGAVDKAMGGLLCKELKTSRTFKGKLGETLVLPTFGKLSARTVIVVGLGKQKSMDAQTLRRAAAAAARACQRLKLKTAATLLHGTGIGGFDVETAARVLGEGTLLGAYQFTRHKKKKTDDAAAHLESVTVVEHDAKKLPAIRRGLQTGQIIAECVNMARDWVFDSANHVTPTFLVKQAKAIPGLTCKVLDFAAIKKLKMGAFELVARGSEEPPALIHLSYTPSGKSGNSDKSSKTKPRKKVALVGKGITFDSGGLSLKPAKSMETMKMDMGGGAAVLATMRAIAALGERGMPLDVQVDGFIPACENMPSGHASRPGDIVTAMNGKTIEVNNTDAEGRLILADALTYAQQQVDPDEIIDLATLTGACITALGHVAAGVMGTDAKLIAALQDAGKAAGEKFWELPMYDEYKDALKSDVADLINAGSGGQAGTSAAAMFLKEFVDDKRKWAHLDIAGTAYTPKDVPEVPKGATGFAVRTLLYYLYGLA